MKYLHDLDRNFKRIAESNNFFSEVQLYLDSFITISKPSLRDNIDINEFHSKISAKDVSYLCVLIATMIVILLISLILVQNII